MRLCVKWLTFLKPMSLAYSLKHCRQMFRPYLRIRPCRFEQARLDVDAIGKRLVLTECNVYAMHVLDGAEFSHSFFSLKNKNPPANFTCNRKMEDWGLIFTSIEIPGHIFLDVNTKHLRNPCCSFNLLTQKEGKRVKWRPMSDFFFFVDSCVAWRVIPVFNAK